MQQGQSAVCRYMTCALVAGALVACGGDELVTTESDAPTTPVIVVSVNSHAPGRAPTGITPPGRNANVVVFAQAPATVFPGIDGAGSLQYVTFRNLAASSGVATTTNTLPATALSAEVRAGTLPAGLYRLTLLQHEAWPVERADVRSRLNLVASAHRDILVTDGQEF